MFHCSRSKIQVQDLTFESSEFPIVFTLPVIQNLVLSFHLFGIRSGTCATFSLIFAAGSLPHSDSELSFGLICNLKATHQHSYTIKQDLFERS